MEPFKTFTKRRREREREGQPVIYIAGPLHESFRNQVVLLLHDAIGEYQQRYQHVYDSTKWTVVWDCVFRLAQRKFGKLELVDGGSHMWPDEQCQTFVRTADTEPTLDLIDIAFQTIDHLGRRMFRVGDRDQALIDPDEAIDQLNYRFREHDLGYQFTDGQLIEVSSQYLHAEAVEPALTLLHTQGFGGPEEEFLSAHRH